MEKSWLKDPVRYTILVVFFLGILFGWHIFDVSAKPPYEVWMEAERIYVVQERGDSVFVFSKLGEDWENTGTLGSKWGDRKKGGE